MIERQSERDIRIQKVQTLRDLGINPYAQSWDKTHMIGNLLDSDVLPGQVEMSEGQRGFRSIEDIIAGPMREISTAGRVMLKRVSGKLAFGQIMDETGQIQLMWEYETSNLSNLPEFKNRKQYIYFSIHDIKEEFENIKSIINDKNLSLFDMSDGVGEGEFKIECTNRFEEIQDIFHNKFNYGFVSKTGEGFYNNKGVYYKNKEWLIRSEEETENTINILASRSRRRYTKIGKDIKDNALTSYKILEKYIDVGDIIGVKGELFVTHKGELTLFVSEYQLLSKAIRPLGDKFHGIGEDNQETAYRQRYLDMIFNRETLERMKFRSNFIKTLREFYWKHDFLEIDCPVLTASASGAAAQPFVTHHNDFDQDYYLRICNETELKKATIGGLEKVFTIATNFRNEGSDPSHLQEFMMLEHQNVYRSYHEDMEFTQEMFDYIFDTLKVSRQFEVKDKNGLSKEVDFTTPRPKIDYVEGVNQASGLDITSYRIEDADSLRADIKAQGIEFEGMDQMGTMTLIDYLYKKVLRPTLVGPVFVYNYPSIIAPLARISDSDPLKCEKRQVVVNGREIINSYGELVDPIRQRANFDEQSKAEASGDVEATSADMEFVKAMEYGMPIQAGFGMGVDRVIALLTQQDNLRDVVMFPLMKPVN